MALPGLFPIYPNPIPMLYQVSLSLPPLPVSEISKVIGITGSAAFLVPNIDYLQKFIGGNIGIADKMAKETLLKNFNSPFAQNDKVFKAYARLNDIDIPDINKYKKDGKIKFPKEEIPAPTVEDMGLKAFEKTIMTSIFETQKPYFEVAKLVIGNVAKIEDIIARVMPLLGVPLKTKSLKPVGNNGVPNGRPKAIGYKNGSELKKALSKLQTISKDGSTIKIDKNGNATRDVTPTGTASVSGNSGVSDNWKIISTVYSTGIYIPGINYQYKYIDLTARPKKAEETAELNLSDDDPYTKYKPERIILGIFRADGTPLNPNEKLNTIGISGNNIVYNPTPFKRADWILKSPKWHLPILGNFTDTRPVIHVWPSFGTPIYKWVKNFVFTEDSKTSPGEGWEIKKYKEEDKNLLTNDPAIKDDPIIVGFDSNQVNEYKSYFTDTVRYKMDQSKDLEKNEKRKYTNDIVNQLNISSHLQNVFLYGQSKSSVYKQINGNAAYPDKLKIAFKPFQIYSAGAEGDEKLSAYNKTYGQQPGFIWIDPESDYETKIIRVDPTTKIAFTEAKGAPQISSTIKSFVKNKTIFSLSNGQNFNIDIKKNNLVVQSYTNVNQYILENWNYKSDVSLSPEKRVENLASYDVSIWSGTSNKNYANKSDEIFKTDDNWVELSKVGTQWFYKEFYFNTTSNQVDPVYNQFVSTRSDKLDDYYSRYLLNKQSIIYYTYDAPADVVNAINSGTNSVPTTTTIISLDTIFTKMKVYKPTQNGRKKLLDGSLIEVNNSKVIKWYFLKNTYDKSNLPEFGKETGIVINYNGGLDIDGNLPVTTSSKEISLYQIKAESTDFPYGKIIDPSKITNEQLSKDELFSKGKYGVGDDESPQEIEVIQRYMLTDMDTESYYIIEGILTDKNTQTDPVPSSSGGGGSQPGGGYYRMPHALGATKVFLSLIVDIISKLIPQIVKLIALFKNPGSFIIEIIKEKLGEGFSMFSKESFATFEKAKALKDEIVKDAKSTADSKSSGSKPKNSDKVNKLKDTFKNSPLSNHVFVDKKGNYKFLLDGLAMLPFEIFGLNIPFGAELNFDNIPSTPIKLILDAKMAKVKNLQDFLTPKIKSFKNVPGGDGKAPTNAGKLAPGLNISDLKSAKSPIYKRNTNLELNTNDVTVDIKYSTGNFINGIDYNYIYINQDQGKVLSAAEDLSNTPNESVDLDKAKKVVDDLNDALKLDPTNQALKDALNKLRGKLGSLADSTQPLIKMLLGIVTIPIKIVGGIIEWLMKFFKSLTNPLTLPSKIIELLSFSWIMDIMSPAAILKLVGIKFKPEKLVEWLALTKVPNLKVPIPKIPNVPFQSNIPSGFDLPSLNYYKDAIPKGKFLIPDDYDIADLNLFFSAPFLPKLPTYTARQFRENPTRPLKLVLPTLCFFEKIINGIIDFIWSTLGIEALIPPPHIKLCANSANPDINDAIKLAKDLEKTSAEPTTGGGTFSNGTGNDVPSDAGFLYDITLDNGTVIKGLNYEEMQKYVKDHEDIGYDFKF